MKKGFTILEMIVALGLFIFAISLAMVSILGSNSIINSAEKQGYLSSSANSVADIIRRYTTNAKIADVAQIVDNANNAINVGLLVRTYSQDTSKYQCVAIAKAGTISVSGSGASAKFIDTITSKSDLSMTVFSATGNGSLASSCVILPGSATYTTNLNDNNVVLDDFNFQLQTISASSMLARYTINYKYNDANKAIKSNITYSSIRLYGAFPLE